MEEKTILLYQLDEQNVTVNVLFKDETFWMTQDIMAQLFKVQTPAISKIVLKAKNFMLNQLFPKWK